MCDFFRAVFRAAFFTGFLPVLFVVFFAALRAVFLPAFRAVAVPAFFGTLAPFSLASERPMAIACFRLVTFLPEPDFKVPFFFRCRALFTRLPALFEYFAIAVLFYYTIDRTG